MIPTAQFCDVLYNEHRETLRLLDAMGQVLESGRNWEMAQKLFDTLCGDLDRHFALEEFGFFPVLSQYRPMLLMEVEHDQLLDLRQALASELSASIQAKEASSRLFASFKHLRDQLEAHIHEEEAGLFPMAERLFEPEEKALVQRKLAELSDCYKAHPDSPPDLHRPEPGYVMAQTGLFQTVHSKPIAYQKLFESEHVTVQHIYLEAGKSTHTHWVPENQCLLLISGKAHFVAQDQSTAILPGTSIAVDSRLRFSLKAETDAHFIAVKVWPRPHFIRV